MVRCHLLPRLRPEGKSKPAADYVIQKCEMHPITLGTSPPTIRAQSFRPEPLDVGIR